MGSQVQAGVAAMRLGAADPGVLQERPGTGAVGGVAPQQAADQRLHSIMR